LVFGGLAVLAGLSAIAQKGPGEENLPVGIITILGALAYRSAKKRVTGEVPSTLLRRVIEIALLEIISNEEVTNDKYCSALIAWMTHAARMDGEVGERIRADMTKAMAEG
jgi:uncharacterized membrane protein YebE (DUF533 family)